MSEQETTYLSRLLKLLDEGKSYSSALAEIPEEYRGAISEHADIIRWIEAERDAIVPPEALLAKILAVIPAEEKKAAGTARTPLFEAIPARKKAVAKRTASVDSFALKASEQIKTEVKPADAGVSRANISWSSYFASDSFLGQKLEITSWKAWAPTLAVLILLFSLRSYQNPGSAGDSAGSQPAAQTFAVATEPSAKVPAASSTITPKAALVNTAAAPTQSTPVGTMSIDQSVATLSSAADAEAASANTSDSDLAASNSTFGSNAANSYDQNAL